MFTECKNARFAADDHCDFEPAIFSPAHDSSHELHGGRKSRENGRMVRNYDLITQYVKAQQQNH